MAQPVGIAGRAGPGDSLGNQPEAFVQRVGRHGSLRRGAGGHRAEPIDEFVNEVIGRAQPERSRTRVRDDDRSGRPGFPDIRQVAGLQTEAIGPDDRHRPELVGQLAAGPVDRQEGAEPLQSLDQWAPNGPESGDAGRKTDAPVGFAVLGECRQGVPDQRQLVIDAIEPAPLVGGVDPALGPPGEVKGPFLHPALDGRLLAGHLQQFQRVGPRRTAHGEACVLRVFRPGVRHGCDQVQIDERRDAVEQRIRRQPAAIRADTRADLLGGGQAERAREHPEPPEQRLLGAVQQLVAPGHRRPHAQLPGGQVDRAVCQQPEDPAVVGQPQLAEQRDGRHHGGPRGGELDGQRRPAEQSVDLHHGRFRGHRTEGVVTADAPAALVEQLDGGPARGRHSIRSTERLARP